MKRPVSALCVLICLYLPLVIAQPATEQLDYRTIAKIRDEGLIRSQVMDHISWLSDVYGPRLTGGPAILQASDWVLKKFNEWGLANAHRETWPFGKGWALLRFSAHMIEPQVQPLIGFPGSWTPGTKGTVTADVVRVQIDSEADFETYRGKLSGKIVLTQPERPVPMLDGRVVHRMTDTDLAEAAATPIPRGRGGRGRAADTSTDNDNTGRGRGAALALAAKTAQFLKAEGVVAVFNRGSDTIMYSVGSDLSAEQQRTDGGTIFPAGNGSRGADAGTGLPTVTLAVEHYNRMVRLLTKGIAVKVELNVETKFYDETTPNGFNTIAEIPGTDATLKDEVVMLGGHLDSWHSATGATDNAAGCSVMMEAIRILKTLNVKPRRTIRIALWSGEEQGLLGSRNYVRNHLSDTVARKANEEGQKVSVYFNLDNGTGKIRGIYLQGNQNVKPIFEQWLEPFKDLGATTTTLQNTGGTDHLSFDAVGIPGFQFIQDQIEYNTRTHHTNMDSYDHLLADDLKQAATIVAAFVYNAAMRDAKIPGKSQ